MTATPLHLDLQREVGLRINWDEEKTSFYPILFLRKMSPSADSIATRDELAENPLAILPTSSKGPLRIEEIELVGNYAVRFVFSDGHSAGIYSWEYLQSLEPPIE